MRSPRPAIFFPLTACTGGTDNPDASGTKEQEVQFIMDKYNYPAVTIEKTATAAPGAVVIVHDDGGRDTVSWMAQEFEKHDLCGTVALVTNKVIKNGVRDEEAIAYWQSILDTGRFSFSSHTRTHKYWGRTDSGDSGTYIYTSPDPIPYETEPGRITSETLGSKEDLLTCFPGIRALAFVKAGFGKNSDGVQITPEAYDIIKKHYITMRNTGGGVDTIPPKDPYNVKSYMVRSTETAADMIAFTDEAVEKGGMIVYLFHGITGDLRTETAKLFAYIGELKKENKIWCTTFEDISLYTQEMRTAKAEAKQDSEAITLTLTDEWDNTVYNYPLTLRVEIVENWKEVSITGADGKTEILPVMRDESGAYIHVKAVPDSGEIRITGR